MVVLVEAVALERDPDLGIHLLEFAFAGGTLGQGVLGERLPDLKRLANRCIGSRRSARFGGYRYPCRPAPYDGAVLLALGVIAGYLVGTFPTAQLVARLVGADDPTTQGSGNPGASNMYRTAGKRAGVLVGVIDVEGGGARRCCAARRRSARGACGLGRSGGRPCVAGDPSAPRRKAASPRQAAAAPDLAAHRHRGPFFFAVVKWARRCTRFAVDRNRLPDRECDCRSARVGGRRGSRGRCDPGCSSSVEHSTTPGSGRSNGMNVGMQRSRRCMRRIP